MESQNHVLIVAGGSGKRMGTKVPKQFLEIAGKPVLQHTMEVFLRFDPHINIILVLPSGQADKWKQLCRANAFKPCHLVVNGGLERYHSVQNGLARLAGQKGVVGIHDGVRPLVSLTTIARCFETARRQRSAIPVLPVIESLRQLEASNSRSVPRKNYVRVQTPQCFDLPTLQQAYHNPLFSDHFTDDASVWETAGHPIHLVEGNTENIKITSPSDLKLAELLLP